MSQYPPGQDPYSQNPYGQPPPGQYPPGQYPQPYMAGYATPMPGNARPGSVTALAIIGIVLGGIGTLCLGCGTVMSVMQLAGGAAMQGFGGQQPQLSQGAQVFSVVAGVLELVLWVVILFAGVGALSLKPFSRTLAINWSYAMIVWAVVKTAVQLAWIGPETVRMMKEMQAAGPGPNAPPPQMMNIMSGAMTAMTVVMFLIYVALPVCYLIWWRKPHVKAAFEGGAAGAAQPGGFGPGGYPPAGYPQ